MRIRETSFLLILTASFLMLLIYVTNPDLRGVRRNNTFVDFRPKVSLLATGDVMLGRTVMTRSLDMDDPTYPFREVGARLGQADITFINLENPIVEGCPRHTTGFRFCASPEMVEGLVFAGVDVVTIANNHIRNYGQEGVDQTVEYLENEGIKVTGFDNLALIEKEGTTFGFIGFDFFSSEPSESDFELVRNSDPKADVLVVGVHWGNEYRDEANENQRQWASQLVESGADLIVGHGPHWVQNVERIESVPVYYSLGNFVFDQMWSEETKKGLAVEFIYRGSELTEEKRLPIFMSSWARPEFVEN